MKIIEVTKIEKIFDIIDHSLKYGITDQNIEQVEETSILDKSYSKDGRTYFVQIKVR